jgi:L-asparaginase
MTLSRILLLSLGGTISMLKQDAGGATPVLSGEALKASVPELARIADLHARSFRQVPGAHLSFADIEALARTIDEAAVEGFSGVVVTQGTDTIEETAFALDLLTRTDLPVVVTGAMRNPGLPGADGAANLVSATLTAAAPEARGLGVLVVFNDEIHAARHVRKTHTANPGTFASPLTGPLGYVVEDRVRVLVRPVAMPRIKPKPSPDDVRVALLGLHLDDDGRQLDLARVAGCNGLVVEAMGGGHVSAAAADAIERAAASMPVILTSRTLAGETLQSTYGFVGGEIDLTRRGVRRVAWLDGRKARVLLTLMLRHLPSVGTVSLQLERWR